MAAMGSADSHRPSRPRPRDTRVYVPADGRTNATFALMLGSDDSLRGDVESVDFYRVDVTE